VILLDTQVVVWLAVQPGLMSPAAIGVVREARAEDGVAISDKTLWEIAMMVSKRRIDVKGPMIDFLRAIEEELLVLPIDASVAERSMTFGPLFPKDPADRIIAATALVHGLVLVTADEAIRKSNEVPCIW
jgi:PIN domain nuclease of toxin-antitoxin system